MALLGQARIIIDQVTLGPGVANVSRDDGVVGQVVTCRNESNSNIGKYQWILLKPRASMATLSSTNTASTQFTPDVDGTYTVLLLVNEGRGQLQRKRLILGVRSAGGYRYPGQGESTEANWTSMFTGQANETGWWEDMDAILRANQALIDATVITVSGEAGLTNSRRLAAGAGVTFVDNGAGSTLELKVSPGFSGVSALLDVAGQPENLVANRTFGASTRSVTKKGQVNLGALGVTSGEYSAVLGGYFNRATAGWSAVLGGSDNLNSGAYSIVGGGELANLTGDYAVIVGGQSNTASSNHTFIGGGSTNTVTAANGAICGGHTNSVTGLHGFIGAGTDNDAVGAHSAVAGGQANTCNHAHGFIGGGSGNIIQGIKGAICGGESNEASVQCFVGGGDNNIANGTNTSIIGGGSNSVSGSYGAILGGYANGVTGDYGTVAGRDSTVSAIDGHVIGRNASVSHAGAIIIKTGDTGAAGSSAINELTLVAPGGIRQFFIGGRHRRSGFSSSANFLDLIEGQATTINNTTVNLDIFAIPTGQDVRVVGCIKGKQSGSSNYISRKYDGDFLNVGGVITTVAATLNVVATNGGVAWTATVAASGTNVRVSYTGAAATTILWTWSFEFFAGGA